MKAKNVTDLVRFDDDGVSRETLISSPQLWSEVICIEGSQQVGPISDPDADAMFVVLAGEVAVSANKQRNRLKQWEAVVAPAGSKIYLKGASPEPTVVLAVTAPPPKGLDEPDDEV